MPTSSTSHIQLVGVGNSHKHVQPMPLKPVPATARWLKLTAPFLLLGSGTKRSPPKSERMHISLALSWAHVCWNLLAYKLITSISSPKMNYCKTRRTHSHVPKASALHAPPRRVATASISPYLGNGKIPRTFSNEIASKPLK